MPILRSCENTPTSYRRVWYSATQYLQTFQQRGFSAASTIDGSDLIRIRKRSSSLKRNYTGTIDQSIQFSCCTLTNSSIGKCSMRSLVRFAMSVDTVVARTLRYNVSKRFVLSKWCRALESQHYPQKGRWARQSPP